MKAISGKRLVEEWRNWRKDHPSGIRAQPLQNPNGTLNLRQWKCLIPGPKSTPWEGIRYSLIISFPDNFPAIPPKCCFDPPLFHPNVSPSGEIRVPELCEDLCWRSSLTVDKILLRIQEIFVTPNIFEGVNKEATSMYLLNYDDYLREVRSFVRSMVGVNEEYV
ncbi:hypothetical protein KR032_012109 [Drosophila birchii]|nr:hypothetical protein KR032_012109 [Drosophila birchii]